MSIPQMTSTADAGQTRPHLAADTGADPTLTAPQAAVVGRLTWMLFGPFALFVTTSALFAKSAAFFSAADGAYFVVLACMLLGRWVEFRTGRALTATGEPATRAHVLRYIRWTGLAGLLFWAAVNTARNF